MGGVLRVYYRGDSRVCGIAILDNISCGIWNENSAHSPPPFSGLRLFWKRAETGTQTA